MVGFVHIINCNIYAIEKAKISNYYKYYIGFNYMFINNILQLSFFKCDKGCRYDRPADTIAALQLGWRALNHAA